MMEYGVIILIFVAALVSSGIMIWRDKSANSIRTILFFDACYYFVFSVIKYKLEGPSLTLTQSFWEASWETYVHYGLLLLGIAIILPILVMVILRKKAMNYIGWHVSLSVPTFLFFQLILGKLTNCIYILLFFLISVAALVIGISAHKTLTFRSNTEFLKIVKRYIFIILLPVFMILFYYPNELFLTNINEFRNPVWSFEFILFIGMTVFWIFLMVIIYSLPSKWQNIMCAVVFAISLGGYLQVMVLNGQMGEMIGQHQQWDTVKFIVNAIIWFLIIVSSIVVCVKNKKYIGYINSASLFLILVLFVSCITLFVQNISSLDRGREELTTDGDLILAGQDNVIVFVLDLYDARLVEEILDAYPSFYDPLNDFTFYDNTTARHTYTRYSIPYLLTATKWQESDVPFSEYAYDGDTFISDIYNHGVDIGVYTDKAYFNEVAYPLVRNVKADITNESDFINTIRVMGKTSFYKLMPFICKENYFYYSGDINDMVKNSNVWNPEDDIPFYERIMSEGVSISNDIESTFRFYHMRGVHYPFYLSENVKRDRTLTQASPTTQARGCMNVVYAYLDQLKALGVYDSSTIIITSDHGEVISYDRVSHTMSDVSRPILFVKKAGQKGEALTRNHAQVTHEQLFSTVLDAYGMDYSAYGPRFEDIGEDEERERYFGYHTNHEGVVTGKVIGDGRSTDDWIVDY